jgi:CheY-like chemotaxis protein
MMDVLHLDETIHDVKPRSNLDLISILVVDDSMLMASMVSTHIRSVGTYVVEMVSNGKEAIRLLHEVAVLPNLIVSDLHMPEMDGLELVQQIKEDFPQIPVVIMTAEGSEELAIQALQSGAASYVSKKNLRRDMQGILEQVLAASKADRRRQQLLKSMTVRQSEYILENDPSLVPLLIQMFQEELSGMGLCSQANRTRIGVALEEALLNAIYHGNLEVSSELKMDGNRFHEVAAERRFMEPYKTRQVFVRAYLSKNVATFLIRDQGPGFDVSKLPDPLDPSNFEKPSGRGLLLIRAFLDEVRHNETGNEITLIKYRDK